MKKLLLFAPIFMALTACGAPTVEDLIEDQETLAEITQECQLLVMQGKDANTDECNNAKKAVAKMTGNLMKGMQSDMNNAMKGIMKDSFSR